MKMATVLILALTVAAGCATAQAHNPDAFAAGSLAPASQVNNDDLSPSQHAEGVTETCAKPYVRNEATAIRIAEAVWLSFYGEQIYEQRPFRAQLVKGIWIVTGSLPKDCPGGVPIARIRREDGQIVQVVHTQ